MVGGRVSGESIAWLFSLFCAMHQKNNFDDDVDKCRAIIYLPVGYNRLEEDVLFSVVDSTKLLFVDCRFWLLLGRGFSCTAAAAAARLDVVYRWRSHLPGRLCVAHPGRLPAVPMQYRIGFLRSCLFLSRSRPMRRHYHTARRLLSRLFRYVVSFPFFLSFLSLFIIKTHATASATLFVVIVIPPPLQSSHY